MGREQVRTSGEHSRSSAWPWGWRFAFFGSLFVCLAVSEWFYLQYFLFARPNPAFSPLHYLVLFVSGAVITIAVERSLAFWPVLLIWRYRFAFLLSPALFIFYAAAALVLRAGLARPPVPSGFILAGGAAVMLGAFLGGLMTTERNESLWENNAPPDSSILQEVHQVHLVVIGVPAPDSFVKRAFDTGLAILGLVLSAPVFALAAFWVWFEDPGPILFVKNSVGKGGVNFHQYKFRTMVRSAERDTGPVPARKQDARVLHVGRLLRKTALDELPQLINILKGEMSFVGPRPQRTVLVHGYLQGMPEYAERHRVLPGLAGLAQVAGDYYLSPRQKLRFDRLYIRYSSLGFDLKLILLAFLITFWLRWRPGWNGRLPRGLLH